MNPFATTIAALAAFAIAIGPIAAGVTKAVDFVRNLVDANRTKKLPKVTWNVVALVFSVLAAILYQQSFVQPIINTIPALANFHLTGFGAEMVTGLGVFGFSGYWHETMDAKSSAAKAAAPRASDVLR